MINLNPGTIIGAIIITMVAFVMLTIGICQYIKKDGPVGFYNLIDPPKKEEITDVIMWNKKHGMIWIAYAVCIELGYCLGSVMQIELLEMIFMMGGIILPLPLMIMRHQSLVKKYKRENTSNIL